MYERHPLKNTVQWRNTVLSSPTLHLWRGSLLPLGREAAPKPATEVYQVTPRVMVLRLLRSPTGRCDVSLNPLATNVMRTALRQCAAFLAWTAPYLQGAHTFWRFCSQLKKPFFLMCTGLAINAKRLFCCRTACNLFNARPTSLRCSMQFRVNDLSIR